MSKNKVERALPLKMALKVDTKIDGQVMTQTIDIIDTLTKQLVNRLMHTAVDMQEDQSIAALKGMGWLPKEDVEGLWFKINTQQDTIDAMEKALKVYEDRNQK
jgi:hypothetical protein